MSCGCSTISAPTNPAGCIPPSFCPPENFGLAFPSLVGPQGPPGGSGTYVPNYALLRLIDPTVFADGYIAYVAGAVSIADGGEGQVVYRASATDADNDGTTFRPANGIGRWFRIFTGNVFAPWFKAFNNGTEATAKLQAAINFASPNGRTVYCPAGDYLISDSLTAPIIDGETVVNALALLGDGGEYRWAGAGTRFVVNPAVGTFPKAILSLRRTRFVDVRGIRFVGLGKTDPSSSAVHYNNFNQGAKFQNCGFEGFYFGVKVGNLGEATPGNDDFCNYYNCEVLNCTYGLANYGVESYKHTFFDPMIDGVSFVFKAFKDAAQTSMMSFGLRDGFVGDVFDTVFSVEGNPNGVLDCDGTVFEVATVTDQPIFFKQTDGGGSNFGTASFKRMQINWGGFGTTQRPFIDVYSFGNYTVSESKIGIYRPIIYARAIDGSIRPGAFFNNFWSNRPVFFNSSGMDTSTGTLRLGDRHFYGQALSAADAFNLDNVGSRERAGIEWGFRKVIHNDTIDNDVLEAGSVLFGATPQTSGEPALEFVTEKGTTGTWSTTCNATLGVNPITVASNVGMYLGCPVLITGSLVGVQTITNINGLLVTVEPPCGANLAGAAMAPTTAPRTALYISETALPTFAARPGSIAINKAAVEQDTSLWLNVLAGNHWAPAGVCGLIVKTATGTHNFGTINSGATVDFDIALTGCLQGDGAFWNVTDGTPFPAGITVEAVSLGGKITLRVSNASAGNIVVGSRDLKVTQVAFRST